MRPRLPREQRARRRGGGRGRRGGGVEEGRSHISNLENRESRESLVPDTRSTCVRAST